MTIGVLPVEVDVEEVELCEEVVLVVTAVVVVESEVVLVWDVVVLLESEVLEPTDVDVLEPAVVEVPRSVVVEELEDPALVVVLVSTLVLMED